MIEADHTSKKESPSVHPDVFVTARSGGTVVVREEKGRKREFVVSIGKDIPGFPSPHLIIAFQFSKDLRDWAYLRVFPDEQPVRLKTEYLPEGIDPKEIIEETKRGLELLVARIQRGEEAPQFGKEHFLYMLEALGQL